MRFRERIAAVSVAGVLVLTPTLGLPSTAGAQDPTTGSTTAEETTPESTSVLGGPVTTSG